MGCSSSKEPEYNEDGTPKIKVSRLRPSRFRSDINKKERESITARLAHTQGAMSELHDRYDCKNATELGRGACGSVMAVKRLDNNELFALKTISLESMGAYDIEELRNEIELQKKLDHPNICKLLESYEDKKRGTVHIVMEMCTGGMLVSRMKTHRNGWSEQAVATMMEQVLSAIKYCHSNGVVHRDIKLDNIMMEDPSDTSLLKLIDFGFAVQVKRGKEGMQEQLGTPSYMAPELCAEDHNYVNYDSSVDIWAIGVTTYILLSGQRPFHHENRAEKRRMIREDPLRFPDESWGHISDEAKDFCSSLLMKDPTQRLSPSDAIKHPWIQQRSDVHKGDDAATALQKRDQIVKSIEAFSNADGMAKIAMQWLAFTVPPAKLNELRDVFRKMDTDDSGTITLQEFKEAMTKQEDLPVSRIEQIFEAMDVTKSGEIEYNEFLAATLASSQQFEKSLSGNSLHAVFNELDTDHDGYISKADIQEFFQDDFDESSIRTLAQHADGADTGRINYDGFKQCVLQMMKTAEDTGATITKIHREVTQRKRSRKERV